MGEQLNEEQTRKLVEISAQLKHLLEMGALGPRAASVNTMLAPGDLIDLVWKLIFGSSREECMNDDKKQGAVFLLSLWNGHPMVSWHLNSCPKEQIALLLATAASLVGKRIDNSTDIIDATIATLEVLKQQDMPEEKSGDLPH